MRTGSSQYFVIYELHTNFVKYFRIYKWSTMIMNLCFLSQHWVPTRRGMSCAELRLLGAQTTAGKVQRVCTRCYIASRILHDDQHGGSLISFTFLDSQFGNLVSCEVERSIVFMIHSQLREKRNLYYEYENEQQGLITIAEL